MTTASGQHLGLVLVHDLPPEPQLTHTVRVIGSFLETWHAGQPVRFLFTTSRSLADRLMSLGHKRQTPPESPSYPSCRSNVSLRPTRMGFWCLGALLRKILHVSTSDSRPHITLKIFTAAGWASNPQQAGGLVHVYSLNDEPENGYSAYRILNLTNNKFNSNTMREYMALAMANPFGRWAGATIAGFPSEHE